MVEDLQLIAGRPYRLSEPGVPIECVKVVARDLKDDGTGQFAGVTLLKEDLHQRCDRSLPPAPKQMNLWPINQSSHLLILLFW